MAMDGGRIVGKMSVLGSVRSALGRDRLLPPWRRAELRRDVQGLAARVERLRRAFPARMAFVDVGLSDDVCRLAGEAMPAAGGVAR